MPNLDLIGYCGVDCSACTDYTGGKCPSCRESTWEPGDECKPIACCKEREIMCCGACAEFPCGMMREFYEESEGHRRAYELMKTFGRQG
ncbi:MAG: DUF3795 domain-containing protein [Ruminococcaceae bacterium]|jgi:hypothetical protein|nr:DUF3795 domain-containing protein [Oscillospiraceae bacterium]